MNSGYVFMSYSHYDKAKVGAIRDFLVENGIHVWDDTQLLQGDDIFEMLAKKLLGANLILAIFSEKTKDSIFCKKEIKYALGEGKTVLPIMLDNVDLGDDIKDLFADTSLFYLQDFETNPATRESFLEIVRMNFKS